MRTIHDSCDAPRHGRREPGPGDLIARVVDVCAHDDRIAAVFLGGSRARGEADDYSDIDLCLILRDDRYDEMIADREAFVRNIGQPLFLEDFGNENMAFVIFADGAELEFNFFRVRDLHEIRSGPHLGPAGYRRDPGRARVPTARGRFRGASRVTPPGPVLVLARPRPLHHRDRARPAVVGGRAARTTPCILREPRSDRPRRRVAGEAHWKLDEEIVTDPLEPVRSSFVAMDRDAMLQAAGEILAFFRERVPCVAEANGLTYPMELDHLDGGHFQDLR